MVPVSEVCRSLGVIVKRACWPFWSRSWTLCSPCPWGRSQNQKFRPESGRFNWFSFRKGFHFCHKDWPCNKWAQREWKICSWWVWMMPVSILWIVLPVFPTPHLIHRYIDIIGSKHESQPSAVYECQVAVSPQATKPQSRQSPGISGWVNGCLWMWILGSFFCVSTFLEKEIMQHILSK